LLAIGTLGRRRTPHVVLEGFIWGWCFLNPATMHLVPLRPCKLFQSAKFPMAELFLCYNEMTPKQIKFFHLRYHNLFQILWNN
jgi:hypothetical protein